MLLKLSNGDNIVIITRRTLAAENTEIVRLKNDNFPLSRDIYYYLCGQLISSLAHIHATHDKLFFEIPIVGVFFIISYGA